MNARDWDKIANAFDAALLLSIEGDVSSALSHADATFATWVDKVSPGSEYDDLVRRYHECKIQILSEDGGDLSQFIQSIADMVDECGTDTEYISGMLKVSSHLLGIKAARLSAK